MTWSIAIFSSRETVDVLLASIAAAARAATGEECVIDVIVNGNRALADALGAALAQQANRAASPIRVWFIRLGDKAHAWNEYVFRIWPGSETAFFIDGYAQVMPDALHLIDAGLRDAPEKLGGSGVVSMGRSAESRPEKRGVHGNLFALKGDVLAQLRKRGFRLPLGIYRNESLIFAVLAFGLDPAKNAWDDRRILIHPQATWSFRPLQLWRPADLRAQLRRILRQSQGKLENMAVRQHLAIAKKPPERLPRTILELVLAWLDAFPADARKVFLADPLSLLAARRMRRARPDWSLTGEPPILLAQTGGETPPL